MTKLEENRWIGWYVRSFKPGWQVPALVFAVVGLIVPVVAWAVGL